MLAGTGFALAAFAASAAGAAADGPALYAEHCAGCHGKEGGGDGPLAKELLYKPRAFREGKFAFGDSVEAMTRTVQSGIPGTPTPRMPPFRAVLKEAEIRAVVAHVRTLLPPAPPVDLHAMRLVVGDVPLFARGILAPLAAGEPPLARGLLAGLPNGFSFEWDAESLALRAVRRGEFLLRADWEERGGRPLVPLGTPLFVAARPTETSPFALGEPPAVEGDHPELAPARARLRTTSTAGGRLELEYDLLSPEGSVRAHVVERPRELVVAGGSGFLQELTVLAAGAPVAVGWSLAVASDPELPLPIPADFAAALDPGMAPAVRHSCEQEELAARTGWHVVRPTPETFVLVRMFVPDDAIASAGCLERQDEFAVSIVARDRPVRLLRALLVRAEIADASFAAMEQELAEELAR